MNRLRRAEAHAAESEVENNQQVWEGEKKGNGERTRPPCLSLFSLCVQCTATGRAHVESVWGGHQALSEWERRRGEGGRKGGRIARESFAPLRANDGTLSLTSAAADGRRGPSALACLVFFHLCLHLLLFSPVLLRRRRTAN